MIKKRLRGASIITTAMLLLIGYPLAVSSAHLLTGSYTPVASWSMRVIQLLLSIWVIVSLRRVGLRSPSALNKTVLIALFIFLTAYTVRLAVETLFSPRLIFEPSSYWIQLIAFSLIPAIAMYHCALAESYSLIFRARWMLLLTGILVSLAPMSGLESYVVERGGRWSAEGLNPITVGQVGSGNVFLGFWMLASSRTPNRLIIATTHRLLGLTAIFVGTGLVVLSASFGALAGTVGTLLIFVLANARSKSTLGFLVFFVSILIFLSSYIITVLDVLNIATIERAQLFLDGGARSLQNRMSAYASTLSLISQHPIFGGGIELAELQMYPHNLLLEGMLATGLFVGSLFLFFLVALAVIAIRGLKAGTDLQLEAMFVISAIISSMLSGTVYGASSFWIATALFLGRAQYLKG